MKKIVLTLNQMFTYIAIGIVHVPFIIFYILMSPVLFLAWVLGYWSKAVRWAENG